MVHDNVYFGRVESGTLESEFSGNLVDICPTGVFTDKTNPLTLTVSGICSMRPASATVAAGCNISPGERYGELRRIENRYRRH